MPEFLAAYLLLGLIAGFVAGLLGVGGGLIIVPVLIWLFDAQGIATGIQPHLALGTSLASILFTSLSSVRAHHRHDAVDWNVLKRFVPGIVAGTLCGAWLTAAIPARPLKVFFVIFLFYAALQMALNFKPVPSRGLPGPIGMFGAGGLIGAVSSWVGIGGGTLSVPFQVWCNVPFHRAVGTSSAIGFPIAFAGMVGYITGGWNSPDLPSYSLGFVSLPALAGIAAGSILTAPLGARTAHSLPVTKLKRVFAILLLLLAARMLFTL
ncbi:MAG: sulfite exporter TauE/SafE family protein [Hydrogenophilaceae bacterium]|nr:sulfite exporter TauE/SafE family protein [Hydrogenophilaceae bacterium]